MACLFIIDPYLHHVAGHELSYALAIAHEARNRRWSVEILGAHDAEPAVATTVENAGFRFVRVALPKTPPFGDRGLRSFVKMNWRSYFRLRQPFQAAAADDRLLVVTTRIDDLTGAAMAAMSRSTRAPVDQVMFFWDLSSGSNRRTRARDALIAAATRVAHRRGAMRLAGQTAPVAADVEQRSGCPTTVVPLIIDWSSVPRPAERHNSRPVVGFMGPARQEKGFDLFIAAMERLQTRVTVGGRISRHVELSEAQFDQSAARLLRLEDSVVEVGSASHSEFYEAFAKLDIIVMAYRPAEYACRTSNVLVEALGMGVIPVVGDGTWLSDFVERIGLPTVFRSGSIESLVETLNTVIDRRDELAARVAALSDGIRAEHNVSTFLDNLGIGVAE